MPDVALKSGQALDICFHPQDDIVFAGLLNGTISCYSYDEAGAASLTWKVRPVKKSARAIATSPNGDVLWCGFKTGMMCSLDPGTGKVVREWSNAHERPISRISALDGSMHMFASADDDGAIKLWDTRSSSSAEAMRTYKHHTDYISDFVWLPDKKHLVATSGDGTLSVLDIRSSKTKPFAESENQEDELLSAIALKGGKKLAVGTQLGPLLIFDRSRGYGDCVDRFLGHPQSIDTMVSLSSSQITSDVVATGSSDGLIRVLQIHPFKFLGVIAEHRGTAENEEDGQTEGLPVERMKLDRNGKWLASISHDDILKLTDVEGALEGSGSEKESGEESDAGEGEGDDQHERDDQDTEEDSTTHEETAGPETVNAPKSVKAGGTTQQTEEIDNTSDEEGSPPPAPINSHISKKRKKKEMKREEAKKRKKGGGPANDFFSGL